MKTISCSSIYSVLNHIFSVCGVLLLSTGAFAVVGGVPVSPSMSRSIVNIAFQKTPCGGVLVGPKTALTAAHCKAMGGEPKKAGLFKEGATAPCSRQDVVDYQVYSGPNGEADLMLIHFENPFCGGKVAKLQPEALEPTDSVFLAGHAIWEFGFGIPTQIEAQVIAMDKVWDHASYPADRPHQKVRISQFLSGDGQKYVPAVPVDNGQSICPGDSGGPVFMEVDGEMKVYGVNGATVGNEKLGARECGFGYVQFISPVAPHIQWIYSTMASWQDNIVNASLDE